MTLKAIVRQSSAEDDRWISAELRARDMWPVKRGVTLYRKTWPEENMLWWRILPNPEAKP